MCFPLSFCYLPEKKRKIRINLEGIKIRYESIKLKNLQNLNILYRNELMKINSTYTNTVFIDLGTGKV